MEPGRVSSNSRKAQVGTAVMCDEYENMVQELEPDGGIPYQCHILDRLYDPYEQDPTSIWAEPVTASVPRKYTHSHSRNMKLAPAVYCMSCI